MVDSRFDIPSRNSLLAENGSRDMELTLVQTSIGPPFHAIHENKSADNEAGHDDLLSKWWC